MARYKVEGYLGSLVAGIYVPASYQVTLYQFDKVKKPGMRVNFYNYIQQQF